MVYACVGTWNSSIITITPFLNWFASVKPTKVYTYFTNTHTHTHSWQLACIHTLAMDRSCTIMHKYAYATMRSFHMHEYIKLTFESAKFAQPQSAISPNRWLLLSKLYLSQWTDANSVVISVDWPVFLVSNRLLCCVCVDMWSCALVE